MQLCDQQFPRLDHDKCLSTIGRCFASDDGAAHDIFLRMQSCMTNMRSVRLYAEYSMSSIFLVPLLHRGVTEQQRINVQMPAVGEEVEQVSACTYLVLTVQKKSRLIHFRQERLVLVPPRLRTCSSVQRWETCSRAWNTTTKNYPIHL